MFHAKPPSCASFIGLPVHCVFAVTFSLLLLAGVASGQSETNGATPLGLTPGAPAGSYALSGFDNVNLFNGHMNFRLPLLSVSGRGSAGYQMTLPVEQTWTIFRQKNEITGVVTYYPEPNWWTSYKPGYGPGVMQGRKSGRGSISCNQYGWSIYSKTLTRLTFTAGDGTEFELRDQLTGGEPKSAINCFNGFNRGKVFVTADGSSATFISDADLVDSVMVSEDPATVSPSGYLLLRDGTRYRIDTGTITWIRDRNGNQLSFLYDSFKRVTSVTDSLNRQITVAYASQTPGSDVVTYKGFGGASRTISVNYDFLQNALRSDQTLQTLRQLFPDTNGSSTTYYNPAVIKSVTLPNNQQYQLLYNSYGEVARAVLPTSGALEYDYGAGLPDGAASGSFGGGPQGKHVYRRVIERRIYPDGGSGAAYESKMTYSRPETTTLTNLGYVVMDQCTPSGTIGQCGGAPALLARQQHYFYGSARSSFYQDGASYGTWQDGREYQTDTYDMDGTIVLQRAQHIFAQRTLVSWWTGTADAAPPNDVRLTETTITIEPVSTNLVSKRTFGYDDSVSFNNQSDVYEYDFGTGAAGSLVRRTHTDYVTAASYTDASTGAHIRSLAAQVSVYDAGGTERARATTEYDNYNPDTNHAALLPRSSISGLDSAYTTSYTTRGNATATTRYLLVNGSVNGSVTAYAQYDIAGNAVKAIDARGNATTIAYDDCFGAPDNNAQLNSAPVELSSAGQISYAFPTLVTNAMNQRSYAQFDYYLGRPVNGEDSNGVIASGYYNDALDRPTQIRRAIGTPAENQTTFSYDDPGRVITTTSDLNANNDNVLTGKVLYDGMGRTTEARQYEGGANYIATQTQYDALGRAYKISNPFRPWQSETAVWTTSAFDALGRVTSVTTPDSAVVTSSYSGNTVMVTDQAGKARKSITDGLGRLISVYEDPTSLNYQTSYSYDVLDDLTTVSQGVQTRTFVYDSLKRLISATNPESGTISYGYDNNGNLTSKLDARNITTTFTYDALNRPTSKSYNDSPQTPPVNYFYDSQTLPPGAPGFDRGYAAGRLVAVAYGSSSAGTYRGYDAMGRIVRQYQQTDAVNYLVEASYYADSSLQNETYPSVPGAGDRRVVSYANDSAGRLVSLSSSATTYAPAASVSSIGYASHNALNTETYGNSLVHAITYSNRLQVNEIKLGTSGAPTSVVDLTYNYGATNNNGNVQSISYSGGGLSYTQSFGYDPLNRLTTSNENSGASWSQTTGYDQYGNRWIDYGGGNHDLSFSTSTNHITTSGYVYDASGNLLNDTLHSYTFDAENKISKVDNVSAYVYDGGGQRVRKLIAENLRFVYDMNGRQIAEFDGSNGNLKKEYLYGASLITIEPTAVNSNGTQYLTSDHLGSPRVTTNSSAAVVSRHDYMPFGEELFAGTGGRTTAQGYSVGDGVRQHFTGYERDGETGLDYAKARYFGNSLGRFTTPDPLMASAKPWIPQSWNRYTYVLNNPLKFTDPNGMIWIYHYSNRKHENVGIAWIYGNKISKELRARGYHALNFGGQTSIDIPTNDGRVLRLSSTSGRPLELSRPEQVGSDSGYVNVGFINEFRRATAPMPAATGTFVGLSVLGGFLAASSPLNATAYLAYALHQRVHDDAQIAASTRISMDDAINKAVDHVGPNGNLEVTPGGNFQFRSTGINSNGQVESRMGRLDINPADPHVIRDGPHLNLETHISGRPVGIDPHTPIDPTTILPGDIP